MFSAPENGFFRLRMGHIILAICRTSRQVRERNKLHTFRYIVVPKPPIRFEQRPEYFKNEDCLTLRSEVLGLLVNPFSGL